MLALPYRSKYDQLLDRLRETLASGTKQIEVARAIGVRPQRVNDWLAGRVHMRGEQALNLLGYLLERKESRQ